MSEFTERVNFPSMASPKASKLKIYANVNDLQMDLLRHDNILAMLSESIVTISPLGDKRYVIAGCTALHRGKRAKEQKCNTLLPL